MRFQSEKMTEGAKIEAKNSIKIQTVLDANAHWKPNAIATRSAA